MAVDTIMAVDAPVRRRPRAWLEILTVLWLAWLYDAISNLAAIRQAAAEAHAHSVLHLEAVLHLDPEKWLNHLLAPHPIIGLWISDYYDNAHFVITFGVLGWLWWRHPGPYRPLRTGLVLINVIGFAIFWRYPMAPPRMVPGLGIVDVVAETGAFGSWHAGTLAHHANELAAMPSLHLAWATWSSWAVWRVARGRRWAAAVWLYPASMAIAVIATGNHFVADVVAGVAVTAVAVPAADVFHRRLELRSVRSARSAGQAEDASAESVSA